jgi:VWFA-related protein
MKKLFVLVSALAIQGLAQTQAPAQQEPIDSHAIIRSETRLVLVDSVVTDKKGNYVHGLTQKDFKVYEDNKEQPITSFSFEANAAADSNRKHYLVLFFDNSTVIPSQQTYAREAATKFIDKNAGPNRLMAIVEFGGTLKVTQNFTDDADRLKKVVAGVKFSAVGSASGGGGIGGRGFSNFSTRGVLGALRDMAKGLADVPGRKQLVFLSGGFPMNQEILTEITATIDVCNRANVAIYPIDVLGLVAPSIGGFVGSLTGFGSLAQRAMLQAAPLAGPLAFAQGRGGTSGGGTTSGGGGGTTSGGGRGSSPGLGGGTTGGARPTTGTTSGTSPGRGATGTTNNTTNSNAGRGGANPNSLNNLNQNALNNRMHGLIPPIDGGITGNQQALYALANGTGGFVIVNTNDLLGGLEKIGNEQNEYYIVGYAPSRESDPGACHTLRVKVDKGGANVRARSGYCEAKTPDLLSGTPAERELEARISGNVQSTVPAASMLTPFFYTAANTARIDVALDVPPGAIKFTKEKGQYKAVMNVVGIAYLPDGSVGARFSDSVKINLPDEKQVTEFEAKPYHYVKQFEAASGKYNLKVVFSSSADQFGKLEAPISIDPWETTGFTLSGLAFSHDIHPAKEANPGLDTELLEDRVPLIASGMRIMEAGSNVFHKTEKGYIYAELYEPALVAPDTKEAPALGFVFKILDATGAVKQDSGVVRLKDVGQLGNPAVPMGLVLNVQELAPGPYKVSVTVVDAANHQFTREAPVEVVN